MNQILPFVLGLSALTLAGCAGSAPNETPATQPVAAGEPSGVINADSATLTVFGMSCPQCSNNLNIQLSAIDGVNDVDVDLGSGDIQLQLEPGQVTVEQLRSRVVLAGYTFDGIRIPA